MAVAGKRTWQAAADLAARFDGGSGLFHCFGDAGLHVSGQGVDRARHGRAVLPRGVQLIDERDHDAKDCLVQIEILGQIAQKLEPGDVDPLKDIAARAPMRVLSDKTDLRRAGRRPSLVG